MEQPKLNRAQRRALSKQRQKFFKDFKVHKTLKERFDELPQEQQLSIMQNILRDTRALVKEKENGNDADEGNEDVES